MIAEAGWPVKVEVEWVDITIHHGWQDLEDAVQRRPALMRAEGYLVAVTATEVSLSLAVDKEYSQRNEVMVIPRGVILRVWVLPDDARMESDLQQLAQLARGDEAVSRPGTEPL